MILIGGNNMKNMFVVYKTDSWHSYASREIIGVTTTVKNAVTICKKQAYKENLFINKEQEFNLYNIKQTQGYNGEGEFHFEEVPVNTLI